MPTAIPDHSPFPPRRDRAGMVGGFHLNPVRKAALATEVVLDIGACNGVDPMSITTWIITATAEFSVTVETPKAEVYAAPPGLTNPVTLNTLAVVKGRWPSIKVTTTGDVYVIAQTNEFQLY